MYDDNLNNENREVAEEHVVDTTVKEDVSNEVNGEYTSYTWESGRTYAEPIEVIQPIQKEVPKKKNNFFKRAVTYTCLIALCFGGGYFGNYISERENGAEVTDSSETASSKEAENTDSVALNSSGNQNYQNTAAVPKVDGTEYSVAEVADMTAESVVEITTETVQNGSIFGQYVAQGAGSGVIITADGYVITNNHVIEGASTINVKLKDGTEYKAVLVGTDVKTDIAVIKMEAKGLKAVVFGDSSGLKVGQDVVAVGNPLGSLGGTVTNGIISALDREIEIDGEAMTLLQTNAAINPGNSGGGLFNLAGELVAVVNAKSSGTDIEGLGFAIPSNTAKSVSEDLINHGYVRGRIGLGMSLVNITDNQTAIRYRVSRLGVYILEVEVNGSAKEAGLQSGDCILSVEGTLIETYSDFTKIIDSHSIGDKIEIKVYRNKQEIVCEITLEEYKPN